MARTRLASLAKIEITDLTQVIEMYILRRLPHLLEDIFYICHVSNGITNDTLVKYLENYWRRTKRSSRE